MRFNIGIILLCITLAAAAACRPERPATPDMRRSVARLEAVSASWDLRMPWNPASLQGGVGTGFIIEGGRILTNAHVVSNAKQILVEREGEPRKWLARVEHIAHDSDLAIVVVDDKSFFEGMQPVSFGALPKLESVVSLYGFPIGGKRMSVTKGIISRIDFLPFAHSGLDEHLAIQVDAAMNPGNSGGPALQDGKVIGVAFQALPGVLAQNTGYIIPTTVVKRFLKDVSDGRYDLVPDLSVQNSPLLNENQRRYLGLSGEGEGVLVDRVLAGGSSDGFLQAGDVVLKIDGIPIGSDEFVTLHGQQVKWQELVERKQVGENISLEIIRNREAQKLSFPLKPIPEPIVRAFAAGYDRAPRFLIYGGLVFQPLSIDIIKAYVGGKEESPAARIWLQYSLGEFLEQQIYIYRRELVVITQVLPDPANVDLQNIVMRTVSRVNGRDIGSLEDLEAAVAQEGEFVVIEFSGERLPAVMGRSAAESSAERLRARYRISELKRLGTEEEEL